MARPPLPIGTPGTIQVVQDGAGAWVARCRFRDHDGVTRRLRKHGPSKTGARNALHDLIRERQRGSSTGSRELTPASRFSDAANLFLAKIERKREDSTHALYVFHLDSTILPALGALRLRECSVARIDAFLEALEPRYAANTRRKLRSIVSGVLQVAVLHEALASNPVRELERIEQPKGQRKAKPRGLTPEERRALLLWLDSSSDDVAVLRKQQLARSADLPDLVRFFLGTGLRIGEALATRRLDVNLDGVSVEGADGSLRVPVVTMAGNVTWVKGKGLVRHDGKTEAALRVIPLPQFAVDMLRRRLDEPGDDDWPIFPAAGRDGRVTYRWPANVRRTLRSVRQDVGLDWMTPHTWRRTYATILDDEVTLTDRMKADLMGHAHFLKDAYVSRGELHTGAAVVLHTALMGSSNSGAAD
ncbi:phage integrase central domain-containing protein [Actinomycetospora sp. TBRC 11914]|uniref:tyrosine-type recombinase/integrase n=1 Tax=Actinomycetospora sp. TBRC 11914 TaxID=2729387 RepID=UPI00145CA1AC|nr:tyrosine-type recombinase/integrase [Actinomycetospora sp. TBRC 11914]NMO88204.1 tyrosine-type recombinase/integrase [Actinomycetospora sp. TBRC 11914]